ncbi:hypothetical protein KY290_031540 [Solanum tuberosum]|uniref:Uncharacterized protein n=1 Tax=Solanum tuberosum TaxID=4113 RepID=A0ABQ7U9G6_SOLTU|nr:hypothetical protein KY284_030594 [Solanum tuberosum]KAH0655891.1 hypothetical protein KY285_030773 [Solanum tuberosum]KAH0743547.1 hypothetical protein KY290_031540 [Solanum tuberosum]
MEPVNKKTELVFIPDPGMSHLVPTMEMAKLLIARNEHLFITVLIMKPPFDNKLMSSYIESVSTNPNYNSQMKFIQLPRDDSISQLFTNKDMITFLSSHKPQVRNSVNEILNS